MKDIDINNTERSEFDKLPHRKWNEDIEFSSMIVLPAKFDYLGVFKYKIKMFLSKLFNLPSPEIWEIGHLHDSGYRRMDFVAIKNGKPLCLLSGASDVIHIEGISGYGMNWLETYGGCPDLTRPVAWNVDCLSVSGLLHFFPSSGKMTCGSALSSFEIYTIQKTIK